MKSMIGLAVLAVVFPATMASADWQLYGAGELGYSIAETSAGGLVRIGATDFPLGGDGNDVSPMLSGAVGLAVPIDEILPRRVTGRARLLEWPVRFELEGVGLRDYDLRTSSIAADTGPISSRVKSNAVMSNVALDIPMRVLYRPISWTSARLFGRWRLRTLKAILERTTFEAGLGIGLSNLKVKVREADAEGSEDAYNFAWQASPGFGYRLTERVKLTLGYRYFDPGDAEITLKGGGIPDPSNSKLKLDNDIHEVRFGVRVLLYEFAGPWR